MDIAVAIAILDILDQDFASLSFEFSLEVDKLYFFIIWLELFRNFDHSSILRVVMILKMEEVKAFEQNYLETLRSKHAKTLATLKEGKLTDEVVDTLNAVAADLAKQYA